MIRVSRTGARAGLFAALFLLVACDGNDDAPTERCLPECSPGYFCLAGTCVEDCNPPCPTGLVCNEERVCEDPNADGDVSLDADDVSLDDARADVADAEDISAPDAEDGSGSNADAADGSGDADAADGSGGWPFPWPEPECDADTLCAEPLVCIGGACVEDTVREPGSFGPIGVVTSFDLGDGCCFDLNNDGFVDNDGAALLAATSGGADPVAEVNQLIQSGLDGLLIEVIDADPEDDFVDFGLYHARNDLDSDGRPDHSPEQRAAGESIYSLRGEALRNGHPAVRFPRATWIDGNLVTTSALQRADVPLAGRCSWLWYNLEPFASGARCRTEGTHDLWLPTAHVEGPLTVEDGGLTTGDGFLQVGAFVHVSVVAEIINANYGDNCVCAGIAPDEDLAVVTVGEDAITMGCAREVPQADIDECPIGVQQCDGIDRMCNLAEAVPGLLAFDTDGDGLRDSLSIGMLLQVRPATVADPALTPRFEFCSNTVDDDGDGRTDCDDPECWDNNSCDYTFPGEYCNDTIDNDDDGIVDCEDPSCAPNRACLPD